MNPLLRMDCLATEKQYKQENEGNKSQLKFDCCSFGNMTAGVNEGDTAFQRAQLYITLDCHL